MFWFFLLTFIAFVFFVKLLIEIRNSPKGDYLIEINQTNLLLFVVCILCASGIIYHRYNTKEKDCEYLDKIEEKAFLEYELERLNGVVTNRELYEEILQFNENIESEKWKCEHQFWCIRWNEKVAQIEKIEYEVLWKDE